MTHHQNVILKPAIPTQGEHVTGTSSYLGASDNLIETYVVERGETCCCTGERMRDGLVVTGRPSRGVDRG